MVGYRQPGLSYPACLIKHRVGLNILVVDHNIAARFDDTRLSARNVGDGWSEFARMIQPDIGDDRELRCVDDVGGVQFAAKPDL